MSPASSIPPSRQGARCRAGKTPRPVKRALLALAMAACVGAIVTPQASAALKSGSQGPVVRALNIRLAALTYLPSARVSRTFTRSTFYAVVAFQKYARLQPDGVVGPLTSAALQEANAPRPMRAGPGRRIEVSLRRQLAFLVDRSGAVRRTVSVSTGRVGMRTPTGSFGIYRREADGWSYQYGVRLPWAAYFVRGVAFHGSSSIPNHPASHGCVRVPLPFAEGVYRFNTVGRRVVVA